MSVQHAPAGAPARRDAGYFIEPTDPQHFSAFSLGRLRHNYDRHPLMRLDALRGLAKNLAPLGKCKFLEPGSTQKSAFAPKTADPEGKSIDEVFDRINEAGSWIALYNVESDPTYNAFLEDVTRGFRALVDREQPGTFIVRGFIFISGPPSITPFHIDRENNFWLQVRGRKIMTLWDHRDRETVSHRAVEDFILHRTLENVRLTDEAMARAHHFDVGPGDGVYFPSTSPHMTRSDRDWVTAGDEVSISIGVVFYTKHTREVAHIHAFNSFLRRLGVSPSEPGRSSWDFAKAPLGKAWVGVRRLLRGYQPPPGFTRG